MWMLSDTERARAVWVDGVGWASDSPTIESRTWERSVSTERAAETAYGDAGATPEDVDVAEVDDTFAYKQLQHLDALGLTGRGIGVNLSGGALGEGTLHEANGLSRTLAAVELLRAMEGKTAVVQSWRGVPSTTSAVAVLRAGEA